MLFSIRSEFEFVFFYLTRLPLCEVLNVGSEFDFLRSLCVLKMSPSFNCIVNFIFSGF